MIGTTFDLSVLRAMGENDDLTPGVRARIVEPPTAGRSRFAHDLFRETLLRRLDDNRRRRLHASAAGTLAARAGTDPAELAHHAEQARPLIAAEPAIDYAVTAAQAASRRLAYEDAVRLWRQAIRIAAADGAPVPAEHRLGLAEAQRRSGDHSGARASYLAAARTDDPVLRARAALGLHQLGHGAEPGHRDVVELLDRAAAALEPSALRAQLLAALARELADGPDGDPNRATRLAAEAVAIARDTPDRTVLGFCLYAQHDVIWAPGSANDRLALAEEMATCASDDAELAFEAAFCRFVAQIDLGDPSAGTTLRELDRLAGASRLPRQRYLVTSRQATMAILTGDHAEAERLIQAAADFGVMIGEPDAVALQMTQLLVLGLAREGYGTSVHLQRSYGAWMPPEFEPETRAMANLAAGDRDAAAAIIRASPPVTQRAWYRWRLAAGLAFGADIAAEAGATDLAERVYAAALPYAGEFASIGGAAAVPAPLALSLGLAAATMGRPATAITHLEAALAAAQRMGARALAARARAELGRALVATGEVERGRRMLAEATDAARELGLAPLLARIEAGQQGPANVLRRDGDTWTLTFDGLTVHMRDTKGLGDLALLLASPGRAITVTELLAGGPWPRRPGLTRCSTPGPGPSTRPASRRSTSRSRRPRMPYGRPGWRPSVRRSSTSWPGRPAWVVGRVAWATPWRRPGGR